MTFENAQRFLDKIFHNPPEGIETEGHWLCCELITFRKNHDLAETLIKAALMFYGTENAIDDLGEYYRIGAP